MKRSLYHLICFLFKIHYENMPIQCSESLFQLSKLKISLEKFDIFNIYSHNIDCGYTLEPPRCGGSNEYPQSMCFGSNIRKKKYTHVNPSLLYKSGVLGVIPYTDFFS